MALPSRSEPSSRRAFLSIASAVLVAILTCGFSGSGWYQPVAVDVGRVVAGIQRIRELKLKKPVPILRKTRAQVARIMLSEVEGDKQQQEQIDARITAGRMLGRYHSTTNVREQSVKLYLSQIEAFYDTRKQQMVILEGAHQISADAGFRLVGYGDRRDDMILAHELTHALQDQNFGIGARTLKLADNSDALLAYKSLIEGDATLAGFAYLRGGMDDTLADFITAHLTDLPQVSAAKEKNVPDALSVPFLFQYAEGAAFVREAYRRGGWDVVDAAFRNPPESTQQIIDPTLYFDHLKHPLQIKVRGFEKILAGWHKVLNDTYGELAMRLILQMEFGRDATQVEVARRWTGDQMVVLTRGKDQTVIWMVAFDDEQGASLFADFYRQILDRVDGPKNLQGVLDGTYGPTPHELEQVDNRVLVVTGSGANQFSNLAPAIWLATEVSDPNPAPNGLGTDDGGFEAFRRWLQRWKDWLTDWSGTGSH
jgi:hypothetical protein